MHMDCVLIFDRCPLNRASSSNRIMQLLFRHKLLPLPSLQNTLWTFCSTLKRPPPPRYKLGLTNVNCSMVQAYIQLSLCVIKIGWLSDGYWKIIGLYQWVGSVA